MEENNKKRGPGRPTDKRKDTVLRLRIDLETHKKLSECAEKQKISMSELVRQAIEEIVRKDEADEEEGEGEPYGQENRDIHI